MSGGLQPNEAVTPWSRGRKLPVEMGGTAGGGTIIHAPQTIYTQTPDADSFRRSQKQTAADMACAGAAGSQSERMTVMSYTPSVPRLHPWAFGTR